MVDVHCHVDLYPDPMSIVNECEQLSIFTIAVTNLPSHFMLGYKKLLQCKKVRLAVGMHPLYANMHAQEFHYFLECLRHTSYIGEIGLDYSKEGIATKEIQYNSFERILSSIKGQNKILSIHSRKAESDVFDLLLKYEIKAAIFHWYTGPVTLVDKIAAAGYYFSINPEMVKSKNSIETLRRIPPANILTESDGPFIECKKRVVKPSDLGIVSEHLAFILKISHLSAQAIIDNNFKRLISIIR